MESRRTILARNLQKYMDEKGKSRNDICHDLRFKYSTFSDWCNGVKYPRIDKIEILANYFCIEISDLIEEKQPSDFEGLLEKNQRLIDWFRSLPEEKQKAIVISQDGPVDVV